MKNIIKDKKRKEKREKRKEKSFPKNP